MDYDYLNTIYVLIHFFLVLICLIILLVINDLRINICLLILTVIIKYSFNYFNQCIITKLEYNNVVPSVTELGSNAVFINKIPHRTAELFIINMTIYLVCLKIIFTIFFNYYKLNPTKILYFLSNYLP
jgi:hypothetical protein